MELTISIEPDEFTDKVAQAFDLEFDGTITTKIPEFSCPPDFNIGMIVGASGSGKSQILNHHFEEDGREDEWKPNKAIVSHFETPDIAIEKLFACGLASVPTLCKPFHVRCYEVLQSSNLNRALNVLKKTKRSCTSNFIIGEAKIEIY